MGSAGAFMLLARNELRLYRRGGLVSRTGTVFLVITQVLLHLIAVAVAFAMSLPSPAGSSGPRNLPAMLGMGLLAMLLLMFSRALAGAVQALHTRGDLDLLLSSPVDRRAVIGVRMASVAAAATLEVALLVWPFANVFVLFGHFEWARAYLLVPAMGMVAGSMAFAVVLLSFRTLGPRRTRVGVQVLAVLVGAGLMVVMYLPGMFREGRGRSPVGDSIAVLASRGGGWSDALLLPAHWLTTGSLHVVLFFVAAAGLLAFVVHATGEPLVGAVIGITGGGARRASGPSSRPLRFRGGFRAIVVSKELRLIARDPYLIAQILQQSLFVLPMSLVLWRSGSRMDLPLAWLTTVWLAAGLSGPLSWLTIAAEDAPDLLAAAPVSRGALIRAKLEAAVLPTLPLCVLPLFFLLGSRPFYAVCLAVCAFGASLSNAVVNMRSPVACKRATFRTRHRGNGASGLLEAFSMLLWVGVCLALVMGGRALGWR